MSYQAILFDLDGTLLDTAADLGAALNMILQSKNLSPLSPDIVRPYAGKGSKGLLKLGLNMEDHHPEFENESTNFLNYYAKTMVQMTAMFDGMEEILLHLEQNHIPWGIVTNKPTCYTSVIVEKLNLHKRAACIVSGDTLNKAKPHPEPILHACRELQVTPAQCLYIGDSEMDVLASKASGMDVIVALYGYIPKEESPEKWDANGFIFHPRELLAYL